jgi:hypothetical protein
MARKKERISGEKNNVDHVPKVEHKILDDRYLLLKTIGHGRYAK